MTYKDEDFTAPTNPEYGIRQIIITAHNESFDNIIAQRYTGDEDDYAVCFTDDPENENEGYSVRGSLAEILEETSDYVDDPNTYQAVLKALESL